MAARLYRGEYGIIRESQNGLMTTGEQRSDMKVRQRYWAFRSDESDGRDIYALDLIHSSFLTPYSAARCGRTVTPHVSHNIFLSCRLASQQLTRTMAEDLIGQWLGMSNGGAPTLITRRRANCRCKYVHGRGAGRGSRRGTEDLSFALS
jgi:hypothetical protein